MVDRRPSPAPPIGVLTPPTIGPTSLTIDPFVGHRVWRLGPGTLVGDSPQDLVLLGAVKSEPWPTAPHRAACWQGPALYGRTRRGAHRIGEGAPALECACGVYALKAPTRPTRPWVWASGRVSLFGRVLEGTDGFRAELGAPVGPLTLHFGMEREHRCLRPLCPHRAEYVRIGRSLLLPRCEQHLTPDVASAGEPIPLAIFYGMARRSMWDRYRVEIEEPDGHR